jgi:hypothetical protein
MISNVVKNFKIKVLDCVIGRRRITMQPSPSGLGQNFILKPIASGKLAKIKRQ